METAAPSRPPVYPKLIRLPAIERPPTVPVAMLAEVKSVADLPSRLVFGDLVPTSFRFEKKGWSAEWCDADGHKTRFRYAGGLSSLELRYAGDEVVTLTASERFVDLGLTAQSLHPGAWLDKLGREWAARYNLRVFPQREEEEAVGGGFPDGHRLTLVMPVPADRLLTLFDLHKSLQRDPALRTDIDAYVRYGFSVVNYIEGHNPPMLSHPVGVVLHHVNALGTPAAAPPLREVDEEGVAALTLQRSHYLYIAHCALREVARLVDRLAGAGFIGAAGTGREGWPEGDEFGAALLPFGYEYVATNAWWFDRDRRRRIFYPRFAEAADREALAAGSGDIWHKALIRDAMKAAEYTRADSVRAFVEGMRKDAERTGPERIG